MSARRTLGPSDNFERTGADLYRETRTGFVRFREFIRSTASGGILAMASVGMVAQPGTIDLLLPTSLFYAAWVMTRRVVLPLRLPKSSKLIDYNHPLPGERKPRRAAGILYIGRDYRTGQEIWVSNEDGRQHVAVPGTTGAGKTVALLSLCANSLAWGSGFIFVDGKADNRLYAEILALARVYGREDDVLALNFLVAAGNKHSNTFNPFAWGNADVIRELLVSQIEANPNGGDKGGNHVFMSRAVALLGALCPVLVWMRDNHGLQIDIESIRFATDLPSIVSLVLDKKFRCRDPETGDITFIDFNGLPKEETSPEALLYPLDAYLGETGGFDRTLALNKQKSDEPAKQHSFVVMHFSATFTQLAVSLGHIFKCEIGDIDMRDVVLNRRILVVNLPALENSGETTQALGRLVVSSLRNMMAQTLGVDLEGDYSEIVENKPHLSPTPYPVVFDEIGYYVVPGMDKMLAMGRGLGFMFYLGFQEVAGLRARIGDAMYSLLGNANLQILMRLQEGSETRKYVEQTAGDTHVTQASSFQANEFGVFRESMNADVRQTSRVNWSDLRSLIEGEAIILFGKYRVYATLFYAAIDAHGPMRINRPIMLKPPAPDSIKGETERTQRTVMHIKKGKLTVERGMAPSPVLDGLLTGLFHRMEGHPEMDVSKMVQGAVVDLHNIPFLPSEIPQPPPGSGTGALQESEYSPMAHGVSAPANNAPVPDAAKAPQDQADVQSLTGSAQAMGASPADAHADAEKTLAMKEHAYQATWSQMIVPESDPEEFEAMIRRLTAKVEAVGQSPSNVIRAA